MAPGLFETSRSAITPPRRFDGEVAKILEDEGLQHSLSGIRHPKSTSDGLPDTLQVKRVSEPTPEDTSEEKEELENVGV